MALYTLRYFFSPGSEVCLWSENSEALERFDLPVKLLRLNLDENLHRKALYIMAWYDTSIDWSYPSAPSPWSKEEKERFDLAAQELYEELCECLGSEFLIKNEYRI
jgi:hypothetical protein